MTGQPPQAPAGDPTAQQGQGSATDQIELSLSDLAFRQVSDRIPALAGYYLGFELIDKNDEGTRAAGLLGFQIGKQLVYVPVIFINGQIKGLEMMYIKGPDLLMSLTKQWVEQIAKGTAAAMGDPDPDRRKSNMGSSAQFDIFEAPRAGRAKGAAAMISGGEEQWNSPENIKIAVEGIYCLNDFTLSGAQAPDLDLVDYLKTGSPQQYEAFLGAAIKNASTGESIINHYGDRIKLTDGDFAIKRAEYEALHAPDMDGDGIKTEVKVIFRDDEEAHDLGDSEKVELMSTGISIVDNRAEDNRVRAVKVENAVQFHNPETIGVYDMFCKGGDTNKVFIAPTAFGIEAPDRPLPHATIIDPSSGYCCVSGNSASLGSDDRKPIVAGPPVDLGDEDTIEGIFKGKLSELSGLKIGEVYVMVDPKMRHASVPFRVENKADGKVRVATDDVYRYRTWDHNDANTFARPIPDEVVGSNGSGLCTSAGTGMSGRGIWLEGVELECRKPYGGKGLLFVPKDYRFVKVTKPYDYGGCCLDGPKNESPESRKSRMAREEAKHEKRLMKVCPLDASEVSAVIMRCSRPLRVEKQKSASADSYTITSDGLRPGVNVGRKEAVRELVEGYGLGGDSALETLDAAGRGHVRFLMHKAAFFPEVDDSAGSTTWSNTPQVTNVQDAIQEDTDYQELKDPFDPESGMFYSDWQDAAQDGGVVNRAAEGGMKQVFDPAAIALLMRTNRPQEAIQDEYLKKMLHSVDAMCRTLLLFYWHNSDFAESYGRDDMAEFEDMLLSTIKDQGTLILFLKQKSVGSSISELDAFSEVV